MPLEIEPERADGASLYKAGFYHQNLAKGPLVVGRVFWGRATHIHDESYTTETFGISNSYICAVHLRHMLPGHTWWDGRHLPTPELVEGSLHIHDQRYDWRSELLHAFDCLLFSLPQTSLDSALGEASNKMVEIAQPTFDADRVDAVMLHLARSVLPALARPSEVNTLFAEHVQRAVAVHIASTYGSRAPRKAGRAHLAPWQLARVLEFLMADLASDVSVSELAAVCGLSSSHFSHAFAATMGAPPHRWLLQKRVEKARDLLEHTNLELHQIGSMCGFADQSHFTRVYSRQFGMAPGRWRRMRRG